MKWSSYDFWPWDVGCVSLGNTDLRVIKTFKKGTEDTSSQIPCLCDQTGATSIYTSGIAGVLLKLYVLYIKLLNDV